MAFGGRERGGKYPNRSGAGAKPPKFVRQIGDCLVVAGVTEFLRYRGKVFLRQKLLRGPDCQPAPGEEQKKTSGTDIIAGAGEQHWGRNKNCSPRHAKTERSANTHDRSVDDALGWLKASFAGGRKTSWASRFNSLQCAKRGGFCGRTSRHPRL